MSRVDLSRVALGTGLARLDLSFGPGLHVLCAAPGPLFSLLLPCLGGLERPRLGRVSYEDREPFQVPELRARAGLLLPEEPLLGPRGSVDAYVGAVRALRGRSEEVNADWLFDGTWHERDASELGPFARRRLALLFALETKAPWLIALHEPFACLEPGEEPRLLEALNQLGETEASILVTTHDARLAARLDANAVYLGRASEAEFATRTVLVRVERPRDVAQLLCRSPLVHGADFEPSRPGELRVHGSGNEDFDEAVMNAIIESRCDVSEITSLQSARRSP